MILSAMAEKQAKAAFINHHIQSSIFLTEMETNYSSGTELWIHLKPDCKFACCFQIYVRKFISLDQKGILGALFYQGSLKISLAGSTCRFMKVQEGPLSLVIYIYKSRCESVSLLPFLFVPRGTNIFDTQGEGQTFLH